MATDYSALYRRLLAPVETMYGEFDESTLSPIVGFSEGGHLSFRTIGRERGERFVTYVSCELAYFPDQISNRLGRYELMACSDEEPWVLDVLTSVGRMSAEAEFNAGDTLDIRPWVGGNCRIQGILFDEVASEIIDNASYGILLCIGVTRAEMKYARKVSPEQLVNCLNRAHVYPKTILDRRSVI